MRQRLLDVQFLSYIPYRLQAEAQTVLVQYSLATNPCWTSTLQAMHDEAVRDVLQCLVSDP